MTFGVALSFTTGGASTLGLRFFCPDLKFF